MGCGNSYKFGTVSTNGQFIDYFEERLSKGDAVVFRDNSFRNSHDFCRAKIADLQAGTKPGSVDYAVLTEVEYPFPDAKPVKRKECDLLIKIQNNLTL